MLVIGLKNGSLEFYGILPQFVLYWNSLAVVTWIKVIF
jgi:hypothetical protein